ncbi:hypothetical protein Q7P37_007094 [Cladosporium fusiforme]
MATQSTQQHPPPANPSRLTINRGRKRRHADLEQLQLREPEPEPEQPNEPPRRIQGMMTYITSIPHSIWSCGATVFNNVIALFRTRDAPPPPQIPAITATRIDAVATNRSGRKRRAVDATPPRFPPRTNNSSAQDEDDASESPDAMDLDPPFPTSFNHTDQETVQKRQSFYQGFFCEDDRERRRRLRQPSPVYQPPHSARTRQPIKDSKINGLISKAHRAQGGSFAQRAAQKAAQKAAEEQAAREAAEREAAELEEAELEALAIEREELEREYELQQLELVAQEEARLAAEADAKAELERAEAEKAARAQDIITALPENVVDKMQDTLSGPQRDRDEVAQMGPFPLQKLSFKRILASDKGTDNWLDDDAVNAWYHAIGEAKNRQTGYVKRDGNVPAYATLNTGWWAKANKEGPAGLKRWVKKAGVGGKSLLKCERFFLPINLGNHWTLLIINGVDRSIEYLDSLGGDGKLQYQMARNLIKSELGDEYHAQEWTDLKRNRSSMQSNMSDCGVFTCFNGLAAAKERPYREISAQKMPMARAMMAGVLMNGGFEGDFDL